MKAAILLRFLPVLGMLLFGVAQAQSPERVRLYTQPDPTSPGGLKGRITRPEAPLQEILAIPTATPEKVYHAEIEGAKRDEFHFNGLPAGKYDLVAIYDNAFYEGLKLNREKSTLSVEDLKKIEVTIQKSEPFFTIKTIHRIEGDTGKGNQARSICTFLRDKSSDLMLEKYEGAFSRSDFRRSYKLVMLKDVGPGWQIVRVRELYPVWMNPKHPLPEHHFSSSLSQIRVADELKELGNLDLGN